MKSSLDDVLLYSSGTTQSTSLDLIDFALHNIPAGGEPASPLLHLSKSLIAVSNLSKSLIAV